MQHTYIITDTLPQKVGDPSYTVYTIHYTVYSVYWIAGVANLLW